MDINNEDLDSAIYKGVNYLISKQNEDGSISFNDDIRWKVWETANTIISIDLVKIKTNSFFNKAIDFLLNVQLEDGSFSYTVTNDRDNYCTETTAICILALAAAKKDVSKNIDFILSKQNTDGSWEIGIPEIIKRRCWPSVTGFVLNTLLYLNVSSDKISKGIDFLIKNQKEDGSWGSNWVYYDTPYYPLHTILSALSQYGLEDSKIFKKAENFIMRNQRSDGHWYTETTEKPRPSKELRTSLALNSLLVSPDDSYMEHIQKGIVWLLNQQESDGHWNGGYFVNWPGKKEDVYSTAMAIRALKKIR